MRIAICDDSQREQDQFIKALHGWDPTRQPECFMTSASLLEAAKQEPPFDIVFLDVYMPSENGVDIAEAFRRLTKLHDRQRPIVTFSTGRGSSTVYLDEIYYLQSMNHAVYIYLSGGREIRVWASLTELEQKLNGNFLKLNRSSIVNMEQIEQMCVDSCILRDGSRLSDSNRGFHAALSDPFSK